MEKIDYTHWLIYLKHLLIGARIMPRDFDCKMPLYKNVPDSKAWKHFYDDGFTPLEAMMIDINES